jgi:rubrerythrin
MMPDVKGTKTEKNLLTAFAGESQARNRYSFFASKAKKEGLVQMSLVFEETANQEKEHAKRLFKFLEGGDVEVQAAFPAGVIGSTAENLKAAAAGENHEWVEMYPSFAAVAREEGLDDIAKVFAQSAIMCLPTYKEGLPKVLLEAAACGLPIVTTDACGCRDVVRQEENGLLVPVRSTVELAEALQRLIEDPELRRKMGLRGREIAVSEFAVEKVVAETMSLYQELLQP